MIQSLPEATPMNMLDFEVTSRNNGYVRLKDSRQHILQQAHQECSGMNNAMITEKLASFQTTGIPAQAVVL